MKYREERKIYFSSTELLRALTIFCETTNLNFPFDDRVQISVCAKPEIIATLSGPEEGGETKEFLESEIAVALILLCNEMDIPTARRAEKSIKVAGETIIFDMKIADEILSE